MAISSYPIALGLSNGEVVDGVFVTDVSIATQFMPVPPSSNGTVYTGGSPSVSWGRVPNFLNQTASLSVNIKSLYVLPSGATLTLNGSLPTGWAFSSNLLTYNGTAVNAVPSTGLTFTASYLGVTANSNTFSVQGLGSVAADTFAPTIALAIQASAITQTTASIGGFMPTDPSPTTAQWSGLKQLNVTVTPSISGSPFTVLTRSVGTEPTLSLQDISSAIPASTLAQSASDVTITTVTKDPSYPTVSGVALAAVQVTGSFWASCRIDTFTAANAYDNVRIEARASLAPNAPYVAVLCQPFAGGVGISSEYRASSGGNASTLQNVANSASPVWLFMLLSGSVFSLYYSLNGNTLVSLGSITQSMGPTLYVGAGVNTNDGVSISPTMRQVSIQTLNPWSLNLTGLSASTNYSVSVTSQDTAGNVSAANTTSFTTAASPGGFKWYPGHYTLGNYEGTVSNIGTAPSGAAYVDIGRMDAAAQSNTQRFQGYELRIPWGVIEPTTQGSYNASLITALNQLLTYLGTNFSGRQYGLIISIDPTAQNAPLPSYITAGISGLGTDAIGNYYSSYALPALWRTAVMSAYTNMCNYLGTQLDSSPYMYMFKAISSTDLPFSNVRSPGTQTPPSDYSTTAYVAALQSLVNNLTTWPTTPKTMNADYGATFTNNAGIVPYYQMLYAGANAQGWGGGGPDVLTGTSYAQAAGEQCFQGILGSVNYQGKMAFAIEVQNDVYQWVNQTSAGDEAYCFNTLKPTHLTWIIILTGQAGGAGNASQFWDGATGTVASLQAVNFRFANTAIPSNL